MKIIEQEARGKKAEPLHSGIKLFLKEHTYLYTIIAFSWYIYEEFLGIILRKWKNNKKNPVKMRMHENYNAPPERICPHPAIKA